MNIQIKLYRKNWYSGPTIHCIGWCSLNGLCYSDQKFHQLLESLIDTQTFGLQEAHKLVHKLIGNYAILIICPENIYLISDEIRSYPLVYGRIGGSFFITDNLLKVKEAYNLPLSVDIRQAELFLVSGVTFEERTIYQDVYGLQAAEIVQLTEPDKILRERYFIYQSNTNSQRPPFDLESEVLVQKKIFSDVFQRMLESAPHVHNWIVPLSGGHDSRMVIYQLYNLGVRNVICYSYGDRNGTQATLSKQVAEALGYDWHFIEYSSEKWHEVREKPIFNQYFDFAFNGISNPHIQDLLAVYELHEQGVLAPSDCFVPGHTFDFITGSQCLKGIMQLRSEKQVAYYLRYFQNQWICRPRSASVQEILIQMIQRYSSYIPFNCFTEFFLWQEWHCKFILNSVRVYEFFGYDWRTPLWDSDLVSYWQSIPVTDKLYRNFLYQCEQAGLYDEPLSSIPFDYHMVAPNSIKKAIHDIIPYNLIRKYKHYFHSKTGSTDDGLHTVYAYNNPLIEDLIPYHSYPEELRYYLKPYLKRPLCWFPDNDNNSLYALRDQFKQKDS